MIPDGETEFADRADFAEFLVGGIVRAHGNFRIENVRQPGERFVNLDTEFAFLLFEGGELVFHGFDLFAGGGIGLAFLAQTVAFAAEKFRALRDFAAFLVQRDNGIDIGIGPADFTVFLDEFGILPDVFNVNHDKRFLVLS